MDIESNVLRLIQDHCGLADLPNPSDRLAEDLGCDSLDSVELAMQIEDEFAVLVNDEDLETVKTVADVIAWVKSEAA